MFLKLSVGVVILALGVYFYTFSTQKGPPLVFGRTFLHNVRLYGGVQILIGGEESPVTMYPGETTDIPQVNWQTFSYNVRSNLALGHEKGASLAFHFGGKPLVDIWGGYADIEALRPWKEDTLSIIYSSIKGVTAVLVALFVDRGWLKYKNLVSHYWPEFGKNGKENITVGMLLSHQGGLSITNGSIPLTWIEEHPEKVLRFLEEQRPAVWPPGTGYAYHGVTFGLYVDVLLTKADPKHRRVDEIFKDEIGKVFGVEIHHGLPNSEYYRAARHVPDSMSKGLWDVITSFDLNSFKTWRIVLNPESMFMKAMKTLTYDSSVSPYALNSPELNRIPLSSFNGFSNAHNLANCMTL